MNINNQFDFFKKVSLTSSGALNVSLAGNGGGTPKLFGYTATNYNDLLTKSGMTDSDLAYVFNSQGTQWLPGTIGGSYYPQGIYVYSGTTWTSDRNNIALQLQLDNDRLDELEDNALKINFFQVQDNAGTGSTISTTFTDVDSSIWDTPIVGSGFTWDGTELTITEDSDMIEFSSSIQGKTTGSNRVELWVRLMQDTGSGYVELTAVSQYAMRNVAVDEANVVMPTFVVPNVTSGDKFKLQIRRVGGTGTNTFGTQGGTYLTAKRYNNV